MEMIGHLQAPAPLFTRKLLPLRTGQEIGGEPEAVRISWRRQKKTLAPIMLINKIL
jgi:hypothetical protein